MSNTDTSRNLTRRQTLTALGAGMAAFVSTTANSAGAKDHERCHDAALVEPQRPLAPAPLVVSF